MLEGLFSRHRNGDRTVNASAARTPDPGAAEHRSRAARGCPYRRCARCPHGIVPDVIRRHLDRRGGRRHLCRQRARRDGAWRLTTFRASSASPTSAVRRGLIRPQAHAPLKAALDGRKIETADPLRRHRHGFTTGHEMRLTHGRIVRARAPYALPGIFRRSASPGDGWSRRAGQSGAVSARLARGRHRGGSNPICSVAHGIADYGTNDADDGIPPRRKPGLRGLPRRVFAASPVRRPAASRIPTVMIEAFNDAGPHHARVSPAIRRTSRSCRVGWSAGSTSTARRVDRARRRGRRGCRSTKRSPLSHPVDANGDREVARPRTGVVAHRRGLALLASSRSFTTSPIETMPASRFNPAPACAEHRRHAFHDRLDRSSGEQVATVRHDLPDRQIGAAAPHSPTANDIA